jgi:putative flippase GtrA
MAVAMSADGGAGRALAVRPSTVAQLLRFGLVGLATNAVGFAIYLGLTQLGTPPMLAMSLVYGAGVLQGFWANRRWTFSFQGAGGPALARYCAAYAIGYLVNLGGLYLLAARLGHQHAIVQAAMVFVVAVLLFVLQRYWVFRALPAQMAGMPGAEPGRM